MKDVKITRAGRKNINPWLRMRLLLWPNHTPSEHLVEIEQIIRKRNQVAFLAFSAGKEVGFVECSIRKRAEGCHTNNVGYIEGWFVDQAMRRRGLGRRLLETAEEWARLRKCKEVASDCECDNELSLKAHLALGYEEKKRLIHFKKSLLRSKMGEKK